MGFIKKIFENLHVCRFSNPLVSKYTSFNTRDIVFECRCGKRKIINVYRSFGNSFPIETTNFITNQEIKKIANKTQENEK